ncbi:MAG TPA: glycoside hydrolase family 57 protein [Candidatus Binatia bacterium]|nr:glycoside hydrolase family 57 protein [Candidatus Binatia bacterium]
MNASSPTGSAKIRLVLLWHMHQPFYKDMVTGEYRLPWVRLHALKDYYGMVKLLDEFPRVHQNFNLVPSLVAQVQDYASGQAHDPFLELVSKPPAELTAMDRRFALRYLFQANPVNMIGRYPRYRELWERYRATCDRPEGPEPYFVTRDYADLQVLSQLAWFDEFLLLDPDVNTLVQKGEDFTPDDQRLVIAKEREFLATVLPAYASAAQGGSIELSATPYYHPILPLICDTNAGADSRPGLPLPTRRFKHPEDATLQIRRALDSHEALFAVRPKGLWPSEGSVSEETLKLAAREGIEWMATDEGVLGRSLDYHFARDGDHLPVGGAERLYNIYRYEKGETRMHLVFRDHRLSDLIGFVYSGMPAADAASHLMENIRHAAQPLLGQGKNAVVPIILDGENAWEYYPQSGREFLRRFYDALQRDEQIEPVTISEAIARENEPDFARLNRLVPGSWIDANFNIWIGAPEDNRAWDLLAEARDYYDRHSHLVPEAQRGLAWEELLIAEGSDWNWWYGPEHHSANDRDFDQLYRKHLSNVYHALEGIPPEELSTPIVHGVVRPSYTPQTAYVRARVDGLVSGYFEWMGAASYTSDQRTSAMHGRQFLLDAVYAGLNEDSVSGRLDFCHGVPEGAYRLVVSFEVWREKAQRKSAPDSYRLTVDAQGRVVQRWGLTNGEERRKLAGFSADNGSAGMNGVEVALDQIFEMRVPFELIRVQEGSRIRLRFAIWREHLPVDSLPLEGWIDLHALPEKELETNLYNFSPAE